MTHHDSFTSEKYRVIMLTVRFHPSKNCRPTEPMCCSRLSGRTLKGFSEYAKQLQAICTVECGIFPVQPPLNGTRGKGGLRLNSRKIKFKNICIICRILKMLNLTGDLLKFCACIRCIFHFVESARFYGNIARFNVN